MTAPKATEGLECWFCGAPLTDCYDGTTDGRVFCPRTCLRQGVLYPQDRERAHAARIHAASTMPGGKEKP